MPVVRVSWFEGKNHDMKTKVAAEITESIVRNTGTDVEVHLRHLRGRSAEQLGR